MERKITAILLFFALLPPMASAWGNETHKYLCEKSASLTWGDDAVNGCLAYNKTAQTKLCNTLLQKEGQDAYEKCMTETDDGNYIHPALIPYLLSSNPEDQKDYGTCPAKGKENEQVMCGNSSIRTAFEKSEKWFGISDNSKSLCERIDAFCIASNYYADSRFKLNNVQNLKMCYSDIESRIDQLVSSGNQSWAFDEYCSFETWVQRAGQKLKGGHTQKFTFSREEITILVENLTAKGNEIKSKPLTVETKMQTTSTTVVSTTTLPGPVVTTTIINETELLNDEVLKEVDQLFSELQDMVKSMSEPTANEPKYEKGQGNIVIQVLITAIIIFGLLIGIFMFVKIELKKYNIKASGETPGLNKVIPPNSESKKVE